MSLEELNSQIAEARRRAMRLYNRALALENPIGDIISQSLENIMNEDLPGLQNQLPYISREDCLLELNGIIRELEMLEEILNG